MSMDADIIVDRRRLRRKLTTWRLAAFLLALIAILGGVYVMYGRDLGVAGQAGVVVEWSRFGSATIHSRFFGAYCPGVAVSREGTTPTRSSGSILTQAAWQPAYSTSAIAERTACSNDYQETGGRCYPQEL